MPKGAAKVQQPELPMKDVTPPKAVVQKGDKPGPHPLDSKPKESAAAKRDRLKAEAMVRPKKGTAVAVDDPAKRAVAQSDQPTSLAAAIVQAITDPRCDPAKMHSLLDFQERLDAREAKRAFDEAFGKLQAELPVIRADRRIEIRAKDSRGERTGAVQQSTPYATFPNIMKTIQPMLTKNGLRLSFKTTPMDPIIVGESVIERILVTGILSGHGHERTSDFAVRPDNSGSKNPTQAQGSGQSYGKRYVTIALLNIISEAIEDADTDGHAGNFKHAKGGFADVADGPRITTQQRDRIIDLMVDAKLKEKAFCVKYGIEQVGFLPASLFDAAVKAIADYKAEAAKRNG